MDEEKKKKRTHTEVKMKKKVLCETQGTKHWMSER